MKAPAFWEPGRGGAAAALLGPFGALYGAGTALRLARGKRARIEGLAVICVGGVIAGGSGKTPTARAIAALPGVAARAPHFLTRGHGGAERGPHRVDLDRDDAARIGDEAPLLARDAPCWVSRDRLAGARAAWADGAGLVVMDDGLQNPALRMDIAICVVDGGFGFGNGRRIPAGPMRESLRAALKRVDLIVRIGADHVGAERAIRAAAAPPPIFRARIRPEPPEEAYDRPLFAFAGVGRPDKVFDSWRAAELALAGTRAFADHHPFTPEDLGALEAEAKRCGATLATTEKDAQRLPADFPALAIPARLVWEDEAGIDAAIALRMPAA